MTRDPCASRATGAVVTTSRIRRPGCPSAPAVRVRAHAPPVSDGPARTRHPAAFRSQHDIVDRVQRLLRHEACGIMLIPAALASALYLRPIGQSDPRVPATVGAGNSVQDVQQGELADGVLVDHAVRGPGRHALMHSSVGMHTAIPLVDGARLDCWRVLPPPSPLPRRVCRQYRYGAGQVLSAT